MSPQKWIRTKHLASGEARTNRALASSARCLEIIFTVVMLVRKELECVMAQRRTGRTAVDDQKADSSLHS